MASFPFQQVFPALSAAPRIAMAALALCILYAILVAIYRVTLHPLAKYPGPLLAKLTNWRTVLLCYGGDRHLHHLKEHETYGSVVRIGPSTLSFNTSTALHAIYGRRGTPVRKADWYLSLDAAAGAFSIMSEIDDEKHAFRRRNMSQAFSEHAVRSAEVYIREIVRRLVRGLDRVMEGEGNGEKGKGGWSKRTSMSDWATWYGFDVVGELAFGTSFGCLESEEHHYVPRLLVGTSQWIYYVGYLPFARFIRPILGTSAMLYLGPSAKENLAFTRLANARLASRLTLEQSTDANEKDARKDTFHYLVRARDPETGAGLTLEQLQADSGLLIAAGGDGIGIVVASTIFYLLRNGSAMTKLAAEVRGAFETKDQISMPKLGELKYLAACVDEAMRMSAPLPSHLPRTVVAPGLVIDGHRIPPGTTVGVPAYAIHHNEAYFPDSFSFQPERWIVDEATGVTAASVAAARKAFFSFSAGARSCIGKNVGYLASKLALANLLWRFDMRAAGEPTGGGRKGVWGREREGEFQMTDYIVGFRNGPMVELRRRA